MCGLEPLNMADEVSRAEGEGCTVHIIAVRHRVCSFPPTHLNISTFSKCIHI